MDLKPIPEHEYQKARNGVDGGDVGDFLLANQDGRAFHVWELWWGGA